jgi:RNA polymerase sigma-70 factor (ECF subfamily)
MELYDPLHERLCRFVQTLVWDREEARDIVSETVLKAYEQLEELKKPGSFLQYLFSIAARLVKKKNMRGRFWGIFNREQSLNIPGSDSSEGSMILSELRTALGKLPALQAEAITLLEVSGLSIKEIASLQNCSEGSVKTRISRARDTLAVLLEKDLHRTKSSAVKKSVILSERL